MASSTELHPSAQRVQEALSRQGSACQVIELPDSTRTAVEAAQAIGCQVGQIVKSLVFRAKESDRPILVIASGPNRVNEKKLAALVGEAIEKPSAEWVHERTGFAIGGIPPLGHREPLTTFIDEDLLNYAQVWAAAGTPHAVFGLAPSELTRIAGGKIMSVK